MIDPRLVICFAGAFMTITIVVQFRQVVRRFAWTPDLSASPARACRLSVVIPARNEEQDIGQSIRSVLAQTCRDLDVIVVNDGSTDRTGEIADELARTDPRLRVLHNPVLPPLWLGKCNAMQQASALATGEFLIFSDADILHKPACFATALAEIDAKSLDFLSFFPRMDFISFWENVALPAMIGGLANLATAGIDDAGSPDAVGVGAFMMVRKAVFDAVGGFESIKGDTLDDVALARLIKKNGYRVGLRGAPGLLEVRLFKDNSHAFWGMTKNILSGLHGRYWLAPLVICLPILVFWFPLYCVVAGIFELNPMLCAAGLATYVIQYLILWSSDGLLCFHPWKALFFPWLQSRSAHAWSGPCSCTWYAAKSTGEAGRCESGKADSVGQDRPTPGRGQDLANRRKHGTADQSANTAQDELEMEKFVPIAVIRAFRGR